MDRLDVNPDTYRRWYRIGQLIEGKNLKILDVGGSPDNEQLKLFIPHDITVANPAYNNIDGTDLPFKDAEFDVTISIDTLEHVPKEKRIRFIQELVRAAKTKTILACPFDEPFVAEMEKTIYEITNHPILAEHISFGLPDLKETLAVIDSLGCTYSVYDNDSLLSWASWILLHQTNWGSFDMSKFNRLLNQAYDPRTDSGPSYRKIVEIIK